jgi:HPt (histidine-containing phosphotransfer) domain-containing protein
MDGYISKPIRPAELAATVERLVPSETARPSPSAAPLPPETPSPPASAGPVPIDLDAARRLADGDEELRAEVAAMFVESSRRHETELSQAVRAADGRRISDIAHALKGSAAAVGATVVQKLAAELETLGREGDPDRLAPLASHLARELERAREYLAAQPSTSAT